MKRLEEVIKAFEEILNRNLSSEEQNHYEIINCLGTVFFEANKVLNEAKTLEEKAVVFDRMKLLHPYLISKKAEIVKKLGMKDVERTVEIKMGFAVFEKESTIYSKHLRQANREKVARDKKKFK